MANLTPEKNRWLELPPILRVKREKFDEALDQRCESFITLVTDQLKSIGFGQNFTIIGNGDWHNGKCSLVIKENGTSRICVLKQRDPEPELFMRQFFCEFSKQTEARCYIPDISVHDGFFTQDYVEEVSVNSQHCYDFGALFSASLFSGMFDLHDENILFTEKGIALIDCDCSWYFQRGVAFLSWMGRSGLIYQNKSMCLDSSILKLLCVFDLNAMREGFNNATNFYINEPDVGEIWRIKSIPFRRVFRGTKFYLKLLQRRYIFEETLDKTWEILVNSGRRVGLDDGVIQKEYAELKNWNIPIFHEKNGYIVLSDSQRDRLKHSSCPYDSYRRRKDRLKKIQPKQIEDLFLASLIRFSQSLKSNKVLHSDNFYAALQNCR